MKSAIGVGMTREDHP
jgi:V-type H+-transporting ATPase subunit B